VSLLQDLSGDKAAIGRATFADIQSRMVGPMQRAFRAGDRIAGVATFMAYVFNDPQAWTKMSSAAQQETLRDVHEWDVMMKGWHSFSAARPSCRTKHPNAGSTLVGRKIVSLHSIDR
jgi:hypothetical protein